jgi:hypothetical protein
MSFFQKEMNTDKHTTTASDSSQLKQLRNIFQEFDRTLEEENLYRKALREYLKSPSENGSLLNIIRDFCSASKITQRHFNQYRVKVLHLIAQIVLDVRCEEGQPVSPHDYYFLTRDALEYNLLQKELKGKLLPKQYEALLELLEVNHKGQRRKAIDTVDRHYKLLLEQLFSGKRSEVIILCMSCRKNPTCNTGDDENAFSSALINEKSNDYRPSLLPVKALDPFNTCFPCLYSEMQDKDSTTSFANQLRDTRNIFQEFNTTLKEENLYRKSIRQYLENQSENGQFLKIIVDVFTWANITERQFSTHRVKVLHLIANIVLEDGCDEGHPFPPRDYYVFTREALANLLLKKYIQGEPPSKKEYDTLLKLVEANYKRLHRKAADAVNRRYTRLLQRLFPDRSKNNNENSNNSDHLPDITSNNRCTSSNNNYDNDNTGDSDNLSAPEVISGQTAQRNNDNNKGNHSPVFHVKKNPSEQASHETEFESEIIIPPSFVEESNCCLLSIEEFTSPSSSSAPSSSSCPRKTFLLSPPSSSSRHAPIPWDDIYPSSSIPGLMNYVDLTAAEDHPYEEEQHTKTTMMKQEPLEEKEGDDEQENEKEDGGETMG